MSENDKPEPTPPVEQTSQPTPDPKPVEVTPQEPAPYGVTNVETLTNAPTDPAAHDDTDVEAALQRETQDGKGDDEVPPSDFQSFATTGVEDEAETHEDVIAQQVLNGKWGAGDVRRERLESAGYDPTEIAKIVNRRLVGGAPTVFPTSVRDDAVAVIRGEWGDEESEIKRNLDRAGKNANAVWAERTQQLGQ